MNTKRSFSPKVGPLSFKAVAKQSGLTGLSGHKFKTRAQQALERAGYQKAQAKSIISGSRKLTAVTLKKVFNDLHKNRVINKTGEAVKNYIETEKARQTRLHNTRMRLRIRENQAAEEILDPDFSDGEKNFSVSLNPATGKTNLTIKQSDVDVNISHRPRLSASQTLVEPTDQAIEHLRDQAEAEDLPID